MEVVPAQEALTSDQEDLSGVTIWGDCCDDGGLGLWEKLPGCPASEILEGEAGNTTDCAFQSERADLLCYGNTGYFELNSAGVSWPPTVCKQAGALGEWSSGAHRDVVGGVASNGSSCEGANVTFQWQVGPPASTTSPCHSERCFLSPWNGDPTETYTPLKCSWPSTHLEGKGLLAGHIPCGQPGALHRSPSCSWACLTAGPTLAGRGGPPSLGFSEDRFSVGVFLAWVV